MWRKNGKLGGGLKSREETPEKGEQGDRSAFHVDVRPPLSAAVA